MGSPLLLLKIRKSKGMDMTRKPHLVYAWLLAMSL